ncbi:MAG: toxin-antitoxin system, antitoxin component, Xre family protein [Moorea sp. SIO1F2]|uniref:toxin-antitoxin system, antitoxin component, Xre family protein n=1 Tax=Moorena sp. SIO1F2 TaxID=2607819 RepID=UPI0013B5D603|nr:toxin-antitoxin system, antitoxin component, Xre family protein [Moorena sp. SIO1F2]NET86343.1 toxin-antitoxin system, antitoxin component, Xre family protein [Moorena sp. SIO1F2]
MTANSTLENRLIEKLKKLSLEQIQQVENLIDALSQENTERELTVLSTKLSESVFAKIWDNPEDAEYDNL